MIFNDTIHVQVERKEDVNAKGINTLEVDDCMCAIQEHLQKV
jgi:hypothetical protein